ncbi:MAG TPA: aldehyde dehydrogenase family protein, partial [Candidatus Deferrimicrobium sp.]|nr:aldehyde dehydrogenase family protein [Candidatus Deferrimicrobium sp.]
MTDRAAEPRFKITYATLRADNEDLHAAFEAGIVAARARLGQSHANLIGGAQRAGDGEFELRSPIDSDILVGRFACGTRQDVRDAIAAARAAQPAWRALGWQARIEIMRRAADLISERLMTYGALMSMEVGKNRMASLGEVAESADLLRY